MSTSLAFIWALAEDGEHAVEVITDPAGSWVSSPTSPGSSRSCRCWLPLPSCFFGKRLPLKGWELAEGAIGIRGGLRRGAADRQLDQPDGCGAPHRDQPYRLAAGSRRSGHRVGMGGRRPLHHDVHGGGRGRPLRVHLRQGVHGGRRPLHLLLRLVQPLRRRHAGAGHLRQPHPVDRRLGVGRCRLLPADRALLGGPREQRGSHQGVHHQQDRRHRAVHRRDHPGDHRRLVPHHRRARRGGPPRLRARLSRLLGRAGAVHRGDGQERPDAVPRVAARCHGRPDPGLVADARRHHGHRRRLPGRADVPAVSNRRHGRRRQDRSSCWSGRPRCC